MSWQLSLFLTLIFICLQGYFAMMEMAIVTFNRVRLQYYVAKGNKNALKISKLLAKPPFLFATTLIGVNGCLQIGSECARRFYIAIGINPDYAPISQIFLVLLFAELTPMLAARFHAEHVASLGISLLHLCSKVLSPIIVILNFFVSIISRIFGRQSDLRSYITREEIQKAIEAKEMGDDEKDQEKVASTLSHHIFTLMHKTPRDLMIPLKKIAKIGAKSSIEEVEKKLLDNYTPYLLVYQDIDQSIFGFISARDLLRDPPNIEKITKPVWFISEKTPITEVLQQLRSRLHHFAVVLDHKGEGVGLITLDQIVEEIFPPKREKEKRSDDLYIDRSFPADASIEQINHDLEITLPTQFGEELEDLVTHLLGHHPKKGEEVHFEGLTFLIENVPLMTERTIRISTDSY